MKENVRKDDSRLLEAVGKVAEGRPAMRGGKGLGERQVEFA